LDKAISELRFGLPGATTNYQQSIRVTSLMEIHTCLRPAESLQHLVKPAILEKLPAAIRGALPGSSSDEASFPPHRIPRAGQGSASISSDFPEDLS
jgi:hypothetical protein